MKNRNRTLLEVNTGVLALTTLAFLIGLILPYEKIKLPREQWYWGILAAAVLVIISYLHMYRCLDRALDFDEGSASKLIVRGYLIRYVAFALILVLVTVGEVLNPLVLCLAYLLIMKVAAYMQPYTHKFYNLLFHETDPIPQPMEDVIKEEQSTKRDEKLD